MTSYLEFVQQEFARGFWAERDKAIKATLAEKGFTDFSEAFMRDNFAWVSMGGFDQFDHLWYHPGQSDAVRIISIQREPDIDLGYKQGDITADIHKQTASAQYY